MTRAEQKTARRRKVKVSACAMWKGRTLLSGGLAVGSAAMMEPFAWGAGLIGIIPA